MYRHRLDARIPLRKLGHAVLGEGPRLGVRGAQPREVDAGRGGLHVGVRGERDDADVGAGVVLGGLEQEGEEERREERVAHVVGAKLDLVAVDGGAGGDRHDAGVVHEEVETGGQREDFVRGVGDGAERGEVELYGC